MHQTLSNKPNLAKQVKPGGTASQSQVYKANVTTRYKCQVVGPKAKVPSQTHANDIYPYRPKEGFNEVFFYRGYLGEGSLARAETCVMLVIGSEGAMGTMLAG